jgi:hypothetical protein
MGHLLHVFSAGSASVRNYPEASKLAMARCTWLLLAFDHDQAGVDAARFWRDIAPQKTRRVLLPHGKDLTDFVSHGGDPAAWIAPILARLNPADSGG